MGPATPNPLKSRSRSTAASWQGGPVEHRVDEVAKAAAIRSIRLAHMLVIQGAYHTCCSKVEYNECIGSIQFIERIAI